MAVLEKNLRKTEADRFVLMNPLEQPTLRVFLSLVAAIEHEAQPSHKQYSPSQDPTGNHYSRNYFSPSKQKKIML